MNDFVTNNSLLRTATQLGRLCGPILQIVKPGRRCVVCLGVLVSWAASGGGHGYAADETATAPEAAAVDATGQGKSPEESRRLLQFADPDLSAAIVAAEPLISSPVAVDFGPDGKVYVAEMYDYPSGVDGNFKPGGRVRVLTSSQGDGNFDRSEVFLDGIPFPTGVTVWRKGILVCAAPDILYAEDQDNDGRADLVKPLFSGFGTDNYQARVNSLEYGLDGWLYGSCGLFGGSIYSSLTGKTFELGNYDFRIRPDTGEIERATGRTQQGRVRDDFDNWFGCDNTHLAFHYPLQERYTRRNPSAPPPPSLSHVAATPADAVVIPAIADLQLFELSGPGGRATAACGIGVYRDRLLGPEYERGLYTCEPVNLLVHHLRLQPHQSTFRGSVIPRESEHAFLSSTDPWFRPVQVRTAPDGTMWVVDMYREVIEHPKWIPEEALAKVNVRGGADQGRIYHVRHTNEPVADWPRLDQATPQQWAAMLESSNGWQRDMAMQMLQWNRSTEVEPELRALAREAKLPETRIVALSVLRNLDKLSLEDGLLAMEDTDPSVRRHAVRLAESFANTEAAESRQALQLLSSLASDADAQVRLQVACSLGQWESKTTGEVLAKLLLAHPADAFLEAAILSSLHESNLHGFTEYLLQQTDQLGQYGPRVFPVLLRMGNDELKVQLAKAVCDTQADGLALWQWRVLPEVLAQRKQNETFARLWDQRGGDALVQRCAGLAGEIIVDEDQNEALRIAALKTLAHWEQGRDSASDVAAEVLNVRNTTPVQLAAIAAMAELNSPASIGLMLDKWGQVSPSVRAEILKVFVSRVSSIAILLERIEDSELRAADIDTVSRQQILNAISGPLREKAERLFSGAISTDRAAVIARYAAVSELDADTARGAELFAKHCATCHRLRGSGSAVGPDLEALAGKSVDFFLQEILDPSRNMDSRYATYIALTDAGRIVTGLLAAESANAITLRMQDGKEETLPRSELEDFRANGTSLMPEGFEQTFNSQQMADLIGFLRSSEQAQ